MKFLVVFAGAFAMLMIPSAFAQPQCGTIVDINNAANNPGGGGDTGDFTVPTPPSPLATRPNPQYQLDRTIGPGEVVMLLGKGSINAGAAAVVYTPNTPWPTTLGETTVTINNEPAPLFLVDSYASKMMPGVDSAIVFQVPFDLDTNHTALLAFNQQGCPATVLTLPTTTVVPAMYGITGSTGNIAVVQDAITGSINSERSPLDSNFIAVYAYGLGKTTFPLTAGVPLAGIAPLDPTIASQVTLVVDGNNLNVLYVGGAPGAVGQYVINAEIPIVYTGGTIKSFSGQILLNGTQIGSFEYWTDFGSTRRLKPLTAK